MHRPLRAPLRAQQLQASGRRSRHHAHSSPQCRVSAPKVGSRDPTGHNNHTLEATTSRLPPRAAKGGEGPHASARRRTLTIGRPPASHRPAPRAVAPRGSQMSTRVYWFLSSFACRQRRGLRGHRHIHPSRRCASPAPPCSTQSRTCVRNHSHRYPPLTALAVKHPTHHAGARHDREGPRVYVYRSRHRTP
jgi:hypothetical protein